MQVKIEPSWEAVLKDEFAKPYFTQLAETIRTRYLERTVYPPPQLVFNAFNLCPLEQVRVVIIGQDPYHGPGQAHGLSFSVQDGVRTPPSLQNIYKEIESDLGTPVPESGNLESWAKQGVLLLNATLTVEKGQPGAHQGLGWEAFTNAAIRAVSEQKEYVVFLLWGRHAQAKEALIDTNKHLVLKAPHPSPFSAHSGFFGCRHFSQANADRKSVV